MASAPTFAPALSSLRDLVAHDGVLTTEELEDIAAGIVERPAVWEPLVRRDAEHRRHELIFEDDRGDAWVLSCTPGQGTGFQGHYISDVGLCCADGGVREDLLATAATTSQRAIRRAGFRERVIPP